MQEKFAIISNEIHKLIHIKPEDDWSMHAWAIHEDRDWYWVPVPNSYESSMVSKHNGDGGRLGKRCKTE